MYPVSYIPTAGHGDPYNQALSVVSVSQPPKTEVIESTSIICPIKHAQQLLWKRSPGTDIQRISGFPGNNCQIKSTLMENFTTGKDQL